MEPLDHLFSEAIQNKISSFLSFPCSSHWSHVSKSVYNSTINKSAKHVILFFNSLNITLMDITPLLRANKQKIPTTNDILDINVFDSILFMNAYINSNYILDQIILSPLNESFVFKNKLRFCCLLRTLYRCKNIESLTLWFDHIHPTTYDLMPIWDKYLKIISNDIIVSANPKKRITQYHLARLRTLKLKFNHSWISKDISSIIDCMNHNKMIKWKLIKNLEITSLNFHQHSLLQCPFNKLLQFWCKCINVSMICAYLEPKGNEWDDQTVNEIIYKYKLLPKSLKILQLFTTFNNIPKLQSISKHINIVLIPYNSIIKTLRLDLHHQLFNELNHNKNNTNKLSLEQMIKTYLSISDNLCLTVLKIIAFQNGRNAQLIQYVLTYLIKFCQSVLMEYEQTQKGNNFNVHIDDEKQKQQNDVNISNSHLYQKGILRLCCLLLYFIKQFYVEVVGLQYEWIANIAHKLHEISEKLRFNVNISKLIKRCSISIDKFVRYATNINCFDESRNINPSNGQHNKLFIPISLPLVSYIDCECTPQLYANSLSYLYATLLTQILYTPSYHSHSRTMINLFKMINYNGLRTLCDTKLNKIENNTWYSKDNRYLAYKILLLCLNENRNLWASQEIANILKSTQNPTNSMGYPTFIQRNEFDDELEGIQQQIKQSCTRILKYNVMIPLANNPMYFTNLLNVKSDKRLMEFNGIFKCKLVTTHYKINETGCRFFSYN